MSTPPSAYRIDPRPPRQGVPHYLKVREGLAAQIESGTLRALDQLPSERQLVERFEVARMTVRQALLQLEGEGLIYRRGRRGWFVTPPRLVYDLLRHINFGTQVRAQGREVDIVLRHQGALAAGPRLAHLFDLAAEDPLYLLATVAHVDGRPCLLAEHFLLPAAVPGFLDWRYDRPLTELLVERYGLEIVQRSVLVRPTVATMEHAEALELPPGAPAVFLRRVKTDGDGRVVEVDHYCWRQDAIEFVIETP